MAAISGISSYQQTNSIWKNNQEKKQVSKTNSDSKSAGANSDVKVSEWKPVSSGSSLSPTVKEGYGTVIGDVNLSDEAKEYYDKLKKKYNGMDFILVSSDLKNQVASRASSYGNANRMVVLIDEEKLERMATDESFRKKYEGLIAMSQTKLQETKNSLISSGANVKNFGMSVSGDGKTSFFATVQKAGEAQAKRLEKKQEAKKEEKAKEKKRAEKEEKEERLEKLREKNRADVDAEDVDEAGQDNQYVEIRASSMEELIDMVSKYAAGSSLGNVLTEAESMVGQNFDFRG